MNLKWFIGLKQPIFGPPFPLHRFISDKDLSWRIFDTFEANILLIIN